jgi:hypothetical protein
MRTVSIVVCALLLCCGLSPAQSKSPAGDKEKILAIINNVLKRKDVDQVLATLKDPTFVSQDSMQSLEDIVKVRDRERALGRGTYEDVVQSQVYANGPLGYAIVQTVWFGKQEDRDVIENRVNTVILYKDGSDWKIIHWHASAGHRRWKD